MLKQNHIYLLIISIFLASNNAILHASGKKSKTIYQSGWIDLNKNGVKDIYEDPTQPVEKRVENLVSQMTQDEKTCQLATLYGFGRVLKDSLPTPAWKNAIWKDGIANIDEHLNGWRDAGTKVNTRLDFITDTRKHVEAMNKTQRFFIEETRLGIPAEFTTECVGGVCAFGTTSFPIPIALGSSWNKDLIYKIGLVAAAEGRAMGYSNLYAPVLDVVRDQRWGRIEENYGEATYLVSQMGVAMVKGIQKDLKAAATAKHFVMYSANFGAREGSARTDPQIPLREAETLLVPPFREVAKAGILGIMASYNDYDGVPIIGSRYWLTERLRHEFGFKGYVVSDSEAMEHLYSKHKVAPTLEDAVAMAVNAGMNVRTTFKTPETMILPLRKALNEGKISEQTLNQRVAEVLKVKFLTGLFDKPYIEDAENSVKTVNLLDHKALSLKASHESIILLKNDKNILPFDKQKLKSIAVIGPNATDKTFAQGRYGAQGVNPVTVLQGIQDKVGKEVVVRYAKGCEIADKNWPESEVLPVFPSTAELAQIDSAVQVAQQSDAVVLVLGGSLLTSGEAKSRTDLNLTGYQLLLAQKVQATGKPVVVVFVNSMPITFNWINKNIPGIIEAWYPGQQGGTALADVIFGDYNPGGKLPITFPRSVGQLPMNFPSKPQAQTDESDEVRLRGKLYPLGFGLSYTTFEYSNLAVTPEKQNSQATFSVSFDLKNTGSRDGDEVVQLYTHQRISSVTVYDKNLCGFERVNLKAGETKRITFNIQPSDLQILNEKMQWVVEPGIFDVWIGASSEDMKLKGKFTIEK